MLYYTFRATIYIQRNVENLLSLSMREERLCTAERGLATTSMTAVVVPLHTQLTAHALMR